jgi:hypothetical protein
VFAVKISSDGPPRQVTFPDYVKEGLREAAPPERPSTLTLQSVMTNNDPYRPAGSLDSLRDAMEAFQAMKATRSLILQSK